MTNEEKINRLRNIQGQTPIYTSDDIWDLEALEAAIEAVETLDKIESRLGNVFEEEDDRLIAVNMFKELEAGIRADNELIAVSGMSIEELTDAFTKGYSLRNPEEQTDWIPVSSERLPEDSGEYLVSVIDEDVKTYKHIGIAWYAHPKDYDVEEGDWRELMSDEKVIAWMPLPKPYEPQESEG